MESYLSEGKLHSLVLRKTNASQALYHSNKSSFRRFMAKHSVSYGSSEQEHGQMRCSRTHLGCFSAKFALKIVGLLWICHTRSDPMANISVPTEQRTKLWNIIVRCIRFARERLPPRHTSAKVIGTPMATETHRRRSHNPP